jgi:hypothetical protein
LADDAEDYREACHQSKEGLDTHSQPRAQSCEDCDWSGIKVAPTYRSDGHEGCQCNYGYVFTLSEYGAGKNCEQERK